MFILSIMWSNNRPSARNSALLYQPRLQPHTPRRRTRPLPQLQMLRFALCLLSAPYDNPSKPTIAMHRRSTHRQAPRTLRRSIRLGAA